MSQLMSLQVEHVFFFLNLKIEISLVEELILVAKVWSSDYSPSPSLIKCS